MPADGTVRQTPGTDTGRRPAQGMLDTNILILRRWVNPAELPDEMAISVVTLGELSAGPHQVRPDEEQAQYHEHAERARRLDVLQRAENEFDITLVNTSVKDVCAQLVALMTAKPVKLPA